MPEVMRLNKLSNFSMAQLGQSKALSPTSCASARKPAGPASRTPCSSCHTLPTVLKYLPVEKAQDARSFMLSFEYWLGTPDNLRLPADAGR